MNQTPSVYEGIRPAAIGHAPAQVTTDGHGASPRAIREMLGPAVSHRCSRYKNKRIEMASLQSIISA